MRSIAGHFARIQNLPSDSGQAGNTEPWIICECGWGRRITTVLRTNIGLVARVLHLEHLVEILSGIRVGKQLGRGS